ncbi:NFX1-type zinc finger-containing protein 1-like [Leptinotarsa decemlineata]|uniref:NFX1-type zinc finger-containing protein 1-like n=1 Tax=Leptinotarsa decemlineata TaxID=7539 RepID=UPI003D304C3D
MSFQRDNWRNPANRTSSNAFGESFTARNSRRANYARPRDSFNNGETNRPPTNAYKPWRETVDFSSPTFLRNTLKNNDCEDILTLITKHTQKYTDALENLNDSNTLVLIVELNAKLCESTFVANKFKILKLTLSDSFMNELNGYVSTLILKDEAGDDLFNSFEQFLHNLLAIFNDAINLMPSGCWRSLQSTTKLIEINVLLIEKERKVQFSDELKEKLVRTKESLEKAEKRFSKRSKTTNDEEEEAEPEDDFRFMDLYPSVQELVTPERNFVRKNVVSGSYKSVGQYLDVQFRLLREDFLNPIREDVCDFLNNVNRRLFNIKIFEEVVFTGQDFNRDDICYNLEVTVNKKTLESLSRNNNSKRLIPGTLLIFSDDDFRTIFCGTVVKSLRVKSRMAQDFLVLTASFKNHLPATQKKYRMIECVSYFEPYYQVLSALQKLPHHHLPMSKYILEVQTSVSLPQYRRRPDDSSLLFLNQSQAEALRGALNEEFVVVQGPPGTGKTFLGLQIVQQLLLNSFDWKRLGPILIVCFTNHALDQFLEGVSNFTDEIVRLGSQSQSRTMSQYSIYEMRKRMSQQNDSEDEYSFYDGAILFEEKKGEKKKNSLMKHLHWSLSSFEKSINNCKAMISSCRMKWVLLLPGFLSKHAPMFRETCFQYFEDHEFLGWLFEDLTVEKAADGRSDYDNFVEFYFNYLDDFETIVLDECVEFDVFESARKRIKRNITANKEYRRTCEHLHAVGDLPIEDLHLIFEECDAYAKDLEEDLKIADRKIRIVEEYLSTKQDPPPENISYDKPFDLPPKVRWQLYNSWVGEVIHSFEQIMNRRLVDYRLTFKALQEAKEPEDVALLKKMDVVGMTTTCAARMHSVIEKLGSPIVIVEEAAEVLEAHIVTVLTKHCKHLILLGDHQQLKPTTSDYFLDKQYNLGVSLFERMVNNKIHCYTLNVQHRMRPEISSLISPVIYPDLKNHESVYEYPEVSGLERPVYFVDHEEPEESFGDSSKLNMFEARFIVNFTKYLLKNRYHPEEITILAAYIGQVVTLKNERLKSEHRGVQEVEIKAVDNFQGEENKIILLSLVRSNNENSVGFLKIENRICVALSRAKEGLFIFGNMKQLCASSKIWRSIKETLKTQEAIGRSLPLKCYQHNKQTLVEFPEDFDKTPDGGCDEPCKTKLDCGHMCTRHCHNEDKDHSDFKCFEPCNKKICDAEGHELCTKRCYERCGECEHEITELLPCGHLQATVCHLKNSLDDIKCTKEVSIDLPCGHVANKLCHIKAEDFVCPFDCDVPLKNCEHKCTLKCHKDKDPEHEKYTCKVICQKENIDCSRSVEKHTSQRFCHEGSERCYQMVMKFRSECSHMYKEVECYVDVNREMCTRPCKKNLPCGHKCVNKCYEVCQPCQKKVTSKFPDCGHLRVVECGKNPQELSCRKICSKKLACGHICKNECGKACQVICELGCSRQQPCGHPCLNKCFEPCACVYKAIPECRHRVKVRCDEEPKRESCQRRCRKSLECGHLCVKKCQEPCACDKKCCQG